MLSIKQGQLGVQLISSLDALYPSILQGPRDEQGDKSQVTEAEVRPCGRTRVRVRACVRGVCARAVAGVQCRGGGAVWEVRLDKQQAREIYPVPLRTDQGILPAKFWASSKGPAPSSLLWHKMLGLALFWMLPRSLHGPQSPRT